MKHHRKTGWTCIDCAQSTRILGEYYMVHNAVWQAANPPPIGMLCIGCLEARIGRPLTAEDFTDAPLNQDPRIRRSARLLALLGPIVWSAEAWAKRPRSRSEQSTPGVP